MTKILRFFKNMHQIWLKSSSKLSEYWWISRRLCTNHRNPSTTKGYPLWLERFCEKALEKHVINCSEPLKSHILTLPQRIIKWSPSEGIFSTISLFIAPTRWNHNFKIIILLRIYVINVNFNIVVMLDASAIYTCRNRTSGKQFLMSSAAETTSLKSSF